MLFILQCNVRSAIFVILQNLLQIKPFIFMFSLRHLNYQLVRLGILPKALKRRNIMNDNPKTQPPNELKETLTRRIAKAGEDDFMVKQLRRQIAAEESRLNSRQLFSGNPCILSKSDSRY